MVKLKNFFLKIINKVIDQKKQKRIKIKLAKIQKLAVKFYQKEKKVFVKFYKKEKKVFLLFCKKNIKIFLKKYKKVSEKYIFLKKLEYVFKLVIFYFNQFKIFAQKKMVFLHRNKFYNRAVQKFIEIKQVIKTKKWAKATLASLAVLILVFVFTSRNNISAATYTFIQNSWGGGASADMAVHPDDQSMWNLFSFKDNNLKIAEDGSSLSLDLDQGSFIQSGYDSFYNTEALFDNVEIFGSGDSATLGLQRADTSTIVPKVAAGWNFTGGNSGGFLVLRNNGTVWGSGTSVNSSALIPVKESANKNIDNVVNLSTNGASSIMLKNDGTVWSWNLSGSAIRVPGIGGTGYIANVSSVYISALNPYVIFNDGTAACWGSNGRGQCGVGTQNTTYPTGILNSNGDGLMAGVTKITAGQYNSVILKSDGSVWTSGDNYVGGLGNGNNTSSVLPVQVVGQGGVGYLSDVVDIASAMNANYALKSDGTVWSWGDDSGSMLGNGQTGDALSPVQVTGLSNVKQIFAGMSAVYVLKNDGTVWAWGSGTSGQLGTGNSSSFGYPVQVKGINGVVFLSDISYISAGNQSAYALKDDGSIFSWGANSNGQLGDNTTTQRSTPVQVVARDLGLFDKVKSVSSSYDPAVQQYGAAYAVKNDGTLWSWGYNNKGQLGDNSLFQRNTPVQVLATANSVFDSVDSVFAGQSSAYAIKLDGTLWSWGDNANGKLGDGSVSQRRMPVQVRDASGSSYLTDVISVATGGESAYALKSDGTVWSWGRNHRGQLGNNSTTTSNIPVQVLGPDGISYLNNIRAITAGSYSAYALKSDGTVWAWGSNANGELGDNTTAQRNIPVQVFLNSSGYLINVVSISSISSSVYALRSDGTVWVWGVNSNGQFGGRGFSSAIGVSAGLASGYALKSDGTVWSWGFGSSGQLGNGSNSQSNSPVQVLGPGGTSYLNDIIQVSSGGTSIYALRSDKTILSWGANATGQLGNNSLSQRNFSDNVLVYSDPYPFNAGYNSYHTSGTYTSDILELNYQVAGFIDLALTQDLPASTTVSIDIRAGNDSDVNDNSWTDWLTNISDGGDISALGSKKFIQYRVNISSENDRFTPQVSAINFNYNYYPSGQTLISSIYDTLDNANIIGLLGMKEGETLPEGTEAILSLRTASTSEEIENATWYDFQNNSSHCDKDGDKFTCAGSALPAEFTEGNDDRYWQYKVTLNSAGAFTPTVSEVEVKYVVNAPPELQNVTALQNTNGLVDISYDARDVDALSGSNTPGKVLPSFEYYYNGSWAPCATLSSNATSSKNVEMVNFTTYTLTWNAKADLNGEYLEDMKIRVKINDGEAANNLATMESSDFTLDTKDPVVNSFVLDARSDATENIIIDVTENNMTDLKMRLSNNSNLSADGLNATSGQWVDYASSSAWIFSSNNSPVVYYQIRDANNNISNAGAISNTVVPALPSNPIYADVSNITTSEWRLFVAWGQSTLSADNFDSYRIFRSVDGTNFSELNPQTDRLNNFFLDYGLDTEETYYYRIATQDKLGNISKYSNVVSDRPDGQGGTDLTPPTISNVEISNINAQSASISWDTDEASDSLVSYITSYDEELASESFSDAPSVGISSMLDNNGRLGRHAVFLDHLEPGTTYYIKISSADPNGNIGSVEYDSGSPEILVLETLAGPVVSDVQVINVNNLGATISWQTSSVADSRVFYSTSTTMENLSEVAVSAESTSHTVELSGLETGQRYYFYVKSGVAEDKNIINGELMYYNFLTTSDNVAPRIAFDADSDINSMTENSVRLSWSTDELATATIEYSVDEDYDSFISNSNYNTDHSFELAGLERGTRYNFRLRSSDANGNERILSGLSFTTLDERDILEPSISNVLAKNVADVSALITWATDEPADSVVEYGTQSSTYTQTASSSAKNYAHSVLLEGLSVKTKYYFKVESNDASGNSTSSLEYSFTTQDTLVAGATTTTVVIKEGGGVLVIDKNDKTKPVISAVFVNNISISRATISWATDEPASSIVEYSSDNSYDLSSINLNTNIAHSQDLKDLSPNTLYYYKISSTDSSGNMSEQYTGTFTTLSLDDISDIEEGLDNEDINSEEELSPEEQAKTDENFLAILRRTFDFLKAAAKSVSSAILESSLLEQQESIKELAGLIETPKIISGPVINVWDDMAVVTWETDKKISSLVAITEGGVSFSNYDAVQTFGNSDVYSTKHQVIIPGLKPNTTYNYQLRGKTQIGSSINVAPDTFKTLALSAKIENYVIDRIDLESASFKWTTSIPTDSSVRIIPYRNGALFYDEARLLNSKNMTTIHEMTADELEPGVFYRVDLSGKDLSGKTLSQTIESFSTSNEEMPFVIEQVKTNSALAGPEGTRVQSIISWDTSKLSTSKIYYRKGVSSDEDNWPFETVEDKNYTRKHLVVVTDFLPGDVYQFQVESIDSNGQKVRSNTYTILTPRQRESVFQVILKNIEQTFGWMGAMR